VAKRANEMHQGLIEGPSGSPQRMGTHLGDPKTNTPSWNTP